MESSIADCLMYCCRGAQCGVQPRCTVAQPSAQEAAPQAAGKPLRRSCARAWECIAQREHVYPELLIRIRYGS